MSFTIIDCEQRSEMWIAARAGRLTGSSASDMMAKIKTGEAAGRRDLRTRLALERITGQSLEDGFVSPSMQHGIDMESKALSIYEANSGFIIDRPGFLALDGTMAGCSLDALIAGGKGIVEAKCPKPATHLEYLRTGKIPTAYRWQCLHNLWVSGAQWCDFISFDDRFPEDLQYLCIRMERVEVDITAYSLAATLFLQEVADEVDSIEQLRLTRAAA